MSKFLTAADTPIQSYARFAGILGVVTLIAGGFGEAYVPSALVVSGDPAATAQRMLAAESLFRWGFAGYLVEALCDAGLTFAFWALLRPVSRNLAMFFVVLRIISTCGFAAAEMLWFGAFITVHGKQQLAGLTSEQVDALAYTLVRVSTFGQGLFSTFYGVATVVLGWLVAKSGYIPRAFGIGLMIVGVPFALRTFLLVLAPAYASPLLMAVLALVFPFFLLWLLVKGVDVAKWRAKVAAAG